MNGKRNHVSSNAKRFTLIALATAAMIHCKPAEDDDGDEGTGGGSSESGGAAGSTAFGGGGSGGGDPPGTGGQAGESTGGSGGEASSGTGGGAGEGADAGTGGMATNGAAGGDGSGGSGAASSGGSGGGGTGGSTSGSGGSDATGGASTSGSGGSDATGGASTSTSGSGGSDTTGASSGGTGGSSVGEPLVVAVTAATAPAVPGGSTLYTITVGNQTDDEIEAIDVQLRMPVGLVFYYTTHAHPNSSACGEGYCIAGEEANWVIETLPAGGTQTITVYPEITDAVEDGDSIAVGIRVSAPDIDPILLTNTVPVYEAPSAQLTLGTVTDPALPGQDVELELDVGHIGETALLDCEITAQLPPGLELLNASDGGVEGDTGEVTWQVDVLPVGGILHRTIQARVASDVVPGNVLVASAEFVHEDGDGVASRAELPLSVLGTALPLKFAVSQTPNPAVPGDRVLYTATITNTASRSIDGVRAMLRMPAPLVSYYTTHADPNSSACGEGYCIDGEEAEFDIGTLPAGSSKTITLNPEVLAAAATDGQLFSAKWELAAAGMNQMNLLKTLPVQAEPAVQLALGTLGSLVTPSESLTLNLNVGQIGPSSLFETTLKLYLPPGLDVADITGDGTETGPGEVSWDLDTVTIAETIGLSVDVTVADELQAGDLLTLRAVLAYEGGPELDSVSEYTVAVIDEELPLSMTVTTTPDPVAPGDRLLYTTTLTNNSERPVDGINLLMRLPKGLSFYYTTHADPDSSACGEGWCVAAEEAEWDIGSLAAGATQVVTVNPEVLVASTVPGSLIATRQRLTAANIDSTLNSQITVATEE